MPRRYDTSTYKKHKRPGAWGSPCPDEIDGTDAQLLLSTGVEAEDAIWNVEGRSCFRAFCHAHEGDVSFWHGHPIPWSRLPLEAKNRLVAAGRLDEATFRRAMRKGWGDER
ncbi:hypothetical protein [Paraliomyxa miuraensis]|uniref:hypothetical protein n=1 Tax=Paraliomyxa miuraensis TaxID=376150 RepID=UPI0022585592|nr:hypothetical protein [Paraliomyxa miuraensis]MCX4244466.1 hypothetical protein [Paraliomyxa miuraensis]